MPEVGLKCVRTRTDVVPVSVDLRVRGGDGFVSAYRERGQPSKTGPVGTERVVR